MERQCAHPNVGAVLFVSLGCESFEKVRVTRAVGALQRPVKTLVIPKSGSTRATVQAGHDGVETARLAIEDVPHVALGVDELIIGSVCGGLDGTSGHPAAGVAFDLLVAGGATCSFEETGELLGCEDIMADRAITPVMGAILRASVQKAVRHYSGLGYGSFAAGYAAGGVTRIKEKSRGAQVKSGSSPISGLKKPGDVPPRGGLYLMNVMPDGEVSLWLSQCFRPSISHNAEIVDVIASGAHMTSFVTGRGSVVGSAIPPVMKICANPDITRALADDMEVNAGVIIEGLRSIDAVGREIHDMVLAMAAKAQTKSEKMGRRVYLDLQKF